MFSSTLFILALIAFFGLNFGYKPFIDRQEHRLENESQTESQQIATGEQVKVVDFYSQLANLEKILKGHILSSRALAFFEETTLPRIYFSKLDFNAKSRTANLAGAAESVEDITKQVQVLQTRPEVESAIFSNVTALAGGRIWQFDLVIAFNQEFLTSKENTAEEENFSEDTLEDDAEFNIPAP